jgi:glucan phosphoethanolaminetransferase (alkaline phosphatase superfamily)
MKAATRWTSIGIFTFLILALSFFPSTCFYGLTGSHWLLGFPFNSGTLKLGTHWNAEIYGFAFLSNILLWSSLFLLLIYLSFRYRQWPANSFQKIFSRMLLVIIFAFVIYFLSVGPVLKILGINAASKFDDFPILVRYFYYPLFHCEGLSALRENYLRLWIM